MVRDVCLDMYLVTVTAVDQSRAQSDIKRASFFAIANDGLGSVTEQLQMYDNDGRAIRHPFGVDPTDKSSFKWLVKAQNVYGSPTFSAECHLDVTTDQNLRFVITPKGAR